MDILSDLAGSVLAFSWGWVSTTASVLLWMLGKWGEGKEASRYNAVIGYWVRFVNARPNVPKLLAVIVFLSVPFWLFHKQRVEIVALRSLRPEIIQRLSPMVSPADVYSFNIRGEYMNTGEAPAQQLVPGFASLIYSGGRVGEFTATVLPPSANSMKPGEQSLIEFPGIDLKKGERAVLWLAIMYSGSRDQDLTEKWIVVEHGEEFVSDATQSERDWMMAYVDKRFPEFAAARRESASSREGSR